MSKCTNTMSHDDHMTSEVASEAVDSCLEEDEEAEGDGRKNGPPEPGVHRDTKHGSLHKKVTMIT